MKKKKNIYSFWALLDSLSDTVIAIIKKINKYLEDKKKSPVIKASVRVICCVIMLAILKIPFFVLGKLGEGIIYICGTTFREILSSVWISAVHYSYGLTTLIIFFRVITQMSKNKEYQFELKGASKKDNPLYNIVLTILKIIIIISFIPLIFVELLLFSSLGIEIGLLTHGIFVFGPILIILGLIVMVSSSLAFISDIAFYDKGGDK